MTPKPDVSPDYNPSSYPPVAVAVDIALFTIIGGELFVLLVERGQDPWKGAWALPGGFVRPDEDLEAAAVRELAEETGIREEPGHLEQLGTYGSPDRDPRMRVVSVAYWAIEADLPVPVGGGDAAFAALVPMSKVEHGGIALAFDHGQVLRDAIERTRSKLEYTTLAAKFCPPEFTIAQLRQVYESVWDVELDQGNFHRKIREAPGFVRQLPHSAKPGAEGGRPASLFSVGHAERLDPPLLRKASPTVTKPGSHATNVLDGIDEALDEIDFVLDDVEQAWDRPAAMAEAMPVPPKKYLGDVPQPSAHEPTKFRCVECNTLLTTKDFANPYRVATALDRTCRGCRHRLSGEPYRQTQPDPGYHGALTARIVGITYRQLDYWARTDLIRPSMSWREGSRRFHRYSYLDLFKLQTIKALLDSGIRLQLIRKAFGQVEKQLEGDIAQVNLVIQGTSVIVQRNNEEISHLLGLRRKNVHVLPLARVKEDLDARIAKLDPGEARGPEAPTLKEVREALLQHPEMKDHATNA